jgi:hypothetical protein
MVNEAEEKKEEGNLPDPVMDVLKDLQEKVKDLKPKEEPPKVQAGPTAFDQREADRKALGFTEEQMAAHERTQMRVSAPLIERTAWATLDKKPDIDTYRKEIEQELSIYPQERRTPDIMEKIYYMVRGKRADSKPAAPAAKGPKVEETRVSRGPGYTGSEPSLSGGREERAPENEELDDREKFIVGKFQDAGVAITEKDFAKSRNAGRAIRELKLPDARPVTSLADIELKRMTGRR